MFIVLTLLETKHELVPAVEGATFAL